MSIAMLATEICAVDFAEELEKRPRLKRVELGMTVVFMDQSGDGTAFIESDGRYLRMEAREQVPLAA